ncbi:hypothetical protein NC653_034291 [Populus alba x Populus x berolinensis]|uniref:Uncharacterized protein n=1 Tax=Populus alba x Populus x berolinensis TaxID=444605 RepID=A0AAD6LMG2_9ROSI|nr:hypothetical protein NC653_034291 [Populus alba x Populus x berolinensis]
MARAIMGPSRENRQDNKRSARQAGGKCLVGQQPPTLFPILLFTADSISYLLLTFFSVYAASPPPHPHLLFTSDRFFQFIFLSVNQISGRENKHKAVEIMMMASESLNKNIREC